MDRDGVIGVSFHRPADNDTFIKRISRVPTLRTRPLKRPSTLYRECRLFENEIFFTICRRSARARARASLAARRAKKISGPVEWKISKNITRREFQGETMPVTIFILLQ